MAENQHDWIQGGGKIKGGYTTLAGHFLDFEMDCGICKKHVVFPVEHEKHMHEKLSDQINKAGWKWIADGTEDGIQLCSDACFTFWELQK